MYVILQSCKQKEVITFSRKGRTLLGAEEPEDSGLSKASTQITRSQASEPHSISVKSLTLVKQMSQVDKSIFSGTPLYLKTHS